jgi:quinol monooxygenase YgiN
LAVINRAPIIFLRQQIELGRTSLRIDMGNQVSWCVELAIDPRELEKHRALTSEMVQFARSERGALVYERFISEDCKTLHVYERYVDSAAALAHMRSFDALFADRFHGMVVRKRFVVCGVPSEELRNVLDAFGAIYVSPLDGFSRYA